MCLPAKSLLSIPLHRVILPPLTGRGRGGRSNCGRDGSKAAEEAESGGGRHGARSGRQTRVGRRAARALSLSLLSSAWLRACGLWVGQAACESVACCCDASNRAVLDGYERVLADK